MTIRTVERARVRPAGLPGVIHVIRDDGGPRRYALSNREGPQTWCRLDAGGEVTVRYAPHHLPPGVRWCPACTGQLAAHLGRIDEIAVLIGLAAGRRRAAMQKWLPCPVCSSLFQRKSPAQRYCSRRCRLIAANRARNATKHQK